MAEYLVPVRKVRRGVNGDKAVLDDGRTVKLAYFPERAAARLLDPIIVFLFALGTFAIVVWDGFLRGFGGTDDFAHESVQKLGLWVSLVVFVILALYETNTTSGRTWGKARKGVRVVSVDGEAVLSEGRAFVRGIVPPAAGVAGSLAAVFVDFRYPPLGGLVFWLLVYLSAMWGRAGRGLPDIAAGTVVIVGPEPDGAPTQTADPEPDGAPTQIVGPEPDGAPTQTADLTVNEASVPNGGAAPQPTGPRTAKQGRRFLIVLLAVVVAGAGFVAVKAMFSSGPGFDRYDETIRGTLTINPRVAFGQQFGPDGDACWPENYLTSSGTVFCELVSTEGLHWDTGDVWVLSSTDIKIGSGFLCLADNAGAPWCWEWSADVEPRPARTPEDATFWRIVVGAGIACGQTRDYVMATCWTVGVDQTEYQQDTLYLNPFEPWIIAGISDDGLGFWAQQRGTGRSMTFPVFTETSK